MSPNTRDPAPAPQRARSAGPAKSRRWVWHAPSRWCTQTASDVARPSSPPARSSRRSSARSGAPHHATRAQAMARHTVVDSAQTWPARRGVAVPSPPHVRSRSLRPLHRCVVATRTHRKHGAHHLHRKPSIVRRDRGVLVASRESFAEYAAASFRKRFSCCKRWISHCSRRNACRSPGRRPWPENTSDSGRASPAFK